MQIHIDSELYLHNEVCGIEITFVYEFEKCMLMIYKYKPGLDVPGFKLKVMW